MDVRSDCEICLRKAGSGLGGYPFTCANGHTLYRGSGLVFNPKTGDLGVPMSFYEPTEPSPHDREEGA